MKKKSLNGPWMLIRDNKSETIEARVPGDVYRDLLRAGQHGGHATFQLKLSREVADLYHQPAVYLHCLGCPPVRQRCLQMQICQ